MAMVVVLPFHISLLDSGVLHHDYHLLIVSPSQRRPLVSERVGETLDTLSHI